MNLLKKTLLTCALTVSGLAHTAEPVNPFDAFVGKYKVVSAHCFNIKEDNIEESIANCDHIAGVEVGYISQHHPTTLYIQETDRNSGLVGYPLATYDSSAEGNQYWSKLESTAANSARWHFYMQLSSPDNRMTSETRTMARNGAKVNYTYSRRERNIMGKEFSFIKSYILEKSE